MPPSRLANIVDLSFGFSGKESFRLNGMSVANMKTVLNADDDGKKGNALPWIIGGLLVAGGVAAIVTAGDVCEPDDLGCWHFDFFF
ncbi:MAG: hypothetical protein V3R20_03125 [Sphingomonadales bacterium]